MLKEVPVDQGLWITCMCERFARGRSYRMRLLAYERKKGGNSCPYSPSLQGQGTLLLFFYFIYRQTPALAEIPLHDSFAFILLACRARPWLAQRRTVSQVQGRHHKRGHLFLGLLQRGSDVASRAGGESHAAGRRGG